MVRRVELIRISRELADACDTLTFSEPVTHVYNPLRYAQASVEQYLTKYGKKTGRIVFLGMNPGPWGMAQTGVPFGEVALVRDWIGIDEKVDKPDNEHPKRPILGFDCPRSEVSGRRVWSWAKKRFGDPDAFFARFFVWNYCPLVFMEESGKNRTPDKLSAEERAPLYEACDLALRRMIEYLEPRMIIGVGKFAEKRAREVLGDMDLEFGSVLHPSPASPLANKGWEPQVEKQLAALGVAL